MLLMYTELYFTTVCKEHTHICLLLIVGLTQLLFEEYSMCLYAQLFPHFAPYE